MVHPDAQAMRGVVAAPTPVASTTAAASGLTTTTTVQFLLEGMLSIFVPDVVAGCGNKGNVSEFLEYALTAQKEGPFQNATNVRRVSFQPA